MNDNTDHPEQPVPEMPYINPPMDEIGVVEEDTGENGMLRIRASSLLIPDGAQMYTVACLYFMPMTQQYNHAMVHVVAFDPVKATKTGEHLLGQYLYAQGYIEDLEDVFGMFTMVGEIEPVWDRNDMDSPYHGGDEPAGTIVGDDEDEE